MKKTLLLISVFIIVLSLSAQNLTIEQMESKWKNLYRKGIVAFDKHNYVNAEKHFLESISLLETNEAQNTKYHINSLIKLGETYDMAEEHQKESYVTNDLKAIRKVLRPGSKKEVDYLYHMGIYLSDLKRYQEALDYLSEALSYDETLAQMIGEKSLILHRTAFCHYCLNHLSQAIDAENRCIEADDNKTPDYYKSLAFYYYKAGDWGSLESMLPRCFDYVREPVLRKFSQSKAYDRAIYWDNAKAFFTDFIPKYAYEHPSDILSSYAYNAALFSKGILLAAENKSTELTLNSNDPELIRLHSHYLELKGKKDRTLDEEFEMQALSDVIIRYQKKHKNEYRQDFRIGWTDVQKNLKYNDIAIEFITIPNKNGDIDYAALSIKKNSKAPKLTRLASFDEMTAIPSDLIYTTPELYNLVWGVLESELEGVQNIFFSAAGLFYNTGIEYLPDEDETCLYQKKNVHRLSSTKEIALHKSSQIKKSTLFGGINYDTKISTMVNQSQKIDSTATRGTFVSIDSIDLRGVSSSGFAYLQGTMDEVNDIALIAMESGIETEVLVGDEGSEANFKQLTGKDLDALHIATHGFYYANNKRHKEIAIDQLYYDYNTHFSAAGIETANEDKMLTRSGLVMAGANNLVRKEPIPDGVQDGILHADEIASMDLSNVSLLVLSACQSGLGQVVSSEGVFGLQRGFKKAGVGSIAMSLWRVNDDATRILMTEMYKNLAEGQTKRGALSNALNTLRSYNGGVYDKPEFWAAFIFIDALD